MSKKTKKSELKLKKKGKVVKEEYDEEMEERVYYAIECNNADGLKYCIQDGASPSMRFEGTNQWGKSALHLSCEKGHYECVEILLQAGAKIDAADDWYQSSLMYSVSTERDEIVNLLLRYGCDVDQRDRFGKSAMHFAIHNWELTCMEALINGGADLNIQDEVFRTPLRLAVTEEGHTTPIKCLIDAGCDINLPDMRERRTPLQSAILEGKKECAEYARILLEAGANSNTRDIFGHTPFMSLIHRGRKDGPNIRENDLGLAEKLIDSGYDVNLRSCGPHWFQFKGTALKMAVQRGCYQLVELLLERGADPDIYDHKNATPLLLTVLNYQADIMKLLIRYNASFDIAGDVKIQDKVHKVNPFGCALLLGSVDVMEMLVAGGYDLAKFEPYLITNDKVPDQLVLNVDIWMWLREKAATPRSLKSGCCVYVRSLLPHPVCTHVKLLPVPPGLRDLLLLNNILGC